MAEMPASPIAPKRQSSHKSNKKKARRHYRIADNQHKHPVPGNLGNKAAHAWEKEYAV